MTTRKRKTTKKKTVKKKKAAPKKPIKLSPITEEQFKDIIGQDVVKRALDFYIRSYNRARTMPHLLLIAPKGCGKTTVARATARCLQSIDSEKTPRYISCAGHSRTTVEQFYNQLVAPYMAERDATLIFDECHNLSDSIQEEFLSILNPNPEYKNTTSFDGREWEFDFHRLSFIFATTEPHAMKEAFVDRLERVELEEYTVDQLGRIVQICLPDHNITKATLDKIATVLRGNARAAQKVSQNMLIYLKGSRKKTFSCEDWKILSETLGILPLGLSRLELNILTVLSGVKQMRLTQLSSITGINRSALQKDLEMYLQKKALMRIEPSGRSITQTGQKYLENLYK